MYFFIFLIFINNKRKQFQIVFRSTGFFFHVNKLSIHLLKIAKPIQNAQQLFKYNSVKNKLTVTLSDFQCITETFGQLESQRVSYRFEMLKMN
jgi:hypothetical protein